MWELASANQRKAAILVAAMAGLLAALGYTLGELAGPGGGTPGLAVAGLLWIVLTLTSYFGGDSIALGLSGARRLQPSDHPLLFNVVEEMTIASQLGAMPAVYLIDDDAPNAFATGRDPRHASVAVTAGLLKLLDRDELQGVIGHELAHIKNRDSLYLMMASVMMGAILVLADAGWRGLGASSRTRTSSSKRGGQAQLILLVIAIALLILAPLIAQLLYLAISRRREYLADAGAAIFTRYPEGLAAALEKIAGSGLTVRSATRATAPLYLVNPLSATAQGLADLSSTHPPISERVNILRGLARAPAWADYDAAFRKITGRPVGVLPAAALSEPAPAPTASAPLPPAAQAIVERARVTTDALWKLNGYRFAACGCGTKFKIPPALASRAIPCPQCGVTAATPLHAST